METIKCIQKKCIFNKDYICGYGGKELHLNLAISRDDKEYLQCNHYDRQIGGYTYKRIHQKKERLK